MLSFPCTVIGPLSLQWLNAHGSLTGRGWRLATPKTLPKPLASSRSRVALLPGSPAIDAGDDAVTNAPYNLVTDERGFPRKVGAHVDIGAYELIPGDLNNDGVVNLEDLSTMLAYLNGNGIVNQSELNLVYSNYLSNSPFLMMTNVAGLGGTNVTFQLTNSIAIDYTVQYSTDLVNWVNLGPAAPQYIFTDTNAPGQPQRFYRLIGP